MSDRRCSVYADEYVDGGPRCCDLTCVLEPELLLWEGDNG